MPKPKLLPEEGGANTPGAYAKRKSPQKGSGNGTRHRNAYGIVLYIHGDSSEPFHLFYREGQFRPAPLPDEVL